MTVREEKQRLRAAARAAEAALTDEYLFSAGEAIFARLIALEEYRAAASVFCYVSGGREADTRRLLAHAMKSGKRVSVPRCQSAGRMEARLIGNLGELTPGFFGLLEPPADAPAVCARDIDFAVIPCLCCAHTGERLGKGGGYYDRFLAGYEGAAAMICPERMIRDSIPMEAHDRAVALVLTEAGVWRGGVRHADGF